ncbi:MAG: sulfatase family protein [Oceanipulchritudo sp.]
MSGRPNILLLTLHDAGRYLGCYGVRTVRTPNIDRIASEGMLFENAFSVSPKCSPSRSAVITGRYPHQNGVLSIVHGHNAFRLHDGERRIGKIMTDAGYATWLLGLQHEHDDPGDLGFAHVDVGYSLMDAPGKLRECLAGRSPGQPFYCQIGSPEAHRPWDRGWFPESGDLGVTVPAYLVDDAGTCRELAQLQGVMEAVDGAIGEIAAALREADCLDNTLLVLTTDHGLPFARAKDTLYDAGTGVFLIMRGARVERRGCRFDGLVSQIDLFATFLDAARIDPPDGASTSRSLLPLLRTGDMEERKAVFSENNYSGCYDPIRAIRTRRYKYIRNFEGNPGPSIAPDYAMLASHCGQGTRFLRSRKPEELYDLREDPAELHNLAGVAEYEQTRAGLEDALFSWMEQTGDPLLDGPLVSTAYRRTMKDVSRWREQRQKSPMK